MFYPLITTFKTAYTLVYSVYYTSYDILFHLKTDCFINRYQDTSLSEKKDLSGFIKFLLIIHAHYHLQNSIYLNFLYLQRNELSIIIDFKIHKQRK